MTNKKKRLRGVNITVSAEAHKKMVMEGLEQDPRQNLRERVNVLNNLPKEI